MKNIEDMIGKKQSKFWVACWKFITPGLVVVSTYIVHDDVINDVVTWKRFLP